MRLAMIAFLAFLGTISLGCHHNVSPNGCGHSCGSSRGGGCGGSCNHGCNSCRNGGLFAHHGGGLGHHHKGMQDGEYIDGNCGPGMGDGIHGHGHLGDGHLGHGHLGHGHLGHGLLNQNAPQHVSRMPHFGADQATMGPPGPPTGTYAYPYYTVRAPRDFLLNNPPSIGP